MAAAKGSSGSTIDLNPFSGCGSGYFSLILLAGGMVAVAAFIVIRLL